MNSIARRDRRRGAIVPMVAFSLIAMLGCVALAIDLGLIATSRTQAQAAADSAAMSGARTFNGDIASSNNLSNVSPNAQSAATDNTILSRAITAAMVNVEVGSYTYDTSLQKFDIKIPKDPNDNYNLVKVTVNMPDIETAFARIWGVTAFNIQTTATAAHRPRDVAIILDHSGSMRFDSLLGIPYNGNRSQSNNSEPWYPRFGGYSSGSANLYSNPASGYTTIGSQIYGKANVTYTTDAGPPIVEDFYQHNAGGAAVKAFTAANTSYENLPDGDNYFGAHNQTVPGGTYAKTIQEIIGSSANAKDSEHGWKGYTPKDTPTNAPYTNYNGAAVTEYNGYTLGPTYWGKTFWIWPPDPRSSNDWRKKFFTYPSSSTRMDDNTRLYDSNGNWRAPSNTTYQIDYTAILSWIKSSPNPFPSKMRAGRISYYTAIPNSITGSYPNWGNDNEKFWKLYIDYCLGVHQTGSSTYVVITPQTGYGDDFTWGSILITPPATGDTSGQVSQDYPAGSGTSVDSFITKNWDSRRAGDRVEITHTDGTKSWYTVLEGGLYLQLDRGLEKAVAMNAAITASTSTMPYLDNPKRPRTHFWFGPMTMVDFLGNYNLSNDYSQYDFRWPGTCHEAPLYTQKLGVRASLQDIQKNHPNDSVSMMMFSTPRYESTTSGQFNAARGALGREYQRLQDALFFPPDTIIDDSGTAGADITTFDDAKNNEVPRAEGGTTPVMGFMLAYNQFSISSTLRNYTGATPTGIVGGNGRKGSQKLVILLTDGVANNRAAATFVTGGGSYNCYYNIAKPGTPIVYPTGPGGSPETQLYNVVQQLCKLDSLNGYATARKPVLVHCLAFGTLFEPTTVSSDKTNALTILNTIAGYGSTTFNASENYIIGDSATRVTKLQAAFKRIMQDGVQVSLLE